MSVLNIGGPASYYFFNRFNVVDNNENVAFHYTSAESFIKILTNSPDNIQLRFTRIDCLNDYSEGSELVALYQDECRSMFNEHVIDELFYKEICDIVPSTYAAFGIPEHDEIYACEHDVYVCCFSSSSDSLPMWNYYIKNDQYYGFNIGVNLNCFNDFELNSTRFFPISVVYDAHQKAAFIRKNLLEANDMYKSSGGVVESQINFLRSMLTASQYMFKNHHSKHEGEIRVLMYTPKTTDPDIPAPMLSKDNTEFMCRGGLLNPYRTVSLPKDALLQVTLSPLPRLILICD